jgi:hypothetical protein
MTAIYKIYTIFTWIKLYKADVRKKINIKIKMHILTPSNFFQPWIFFMKIRWLFFKNEIISTFAQSCRQYYLSSKLFPDN